MKTSYLSLGSNLGDRESYLEQAIARLEAGGARVVRRSAVYETEPQDYLDQPRFLNMAVEVETDLAPRELLALIQSIESALGRQRTIPKGPRTIDLDILFYGDIVMTTAELEIPHPRIAQRRFVLDPLAEIAPELRHPVTHQTAGEMLAELTSHS
ncbi:MAG TPA: 2-amino-4-hydroxy-6-hydroxymethyldihydropteridine diphosphokinase [Bryobacteraceae bacterium]|nr:2-amino-4-hydroxy-6-hydroxymethyldihydropteridine diphosphokinase [Bryobacteraceae bacterium]